MVIVVISFAVFMWAIFGFFLAGLLEGRVSAPNSLLKKTLLTLLLGPFAWLTALAILLTKD